MFATIFHLFCTPASADYRHDAAATDDYCDWDYNNLVDHNNRDWGHDALDDYCYDVDYEDDDDYYDDYDDDEYGSNEDEG